ncbi:MAG TPA: hypothetical protein VI318_14110 [Baekduia sp.]
MPRVTIERFDPPTSQHASRVRWWAGARAADELGGRHVWCASASPRGRGAARALEGLLRAGGGLDAASLDVDGGAWLRDLARQLDALLTQLRAPLGVEQRADCAAAAAAGERAIGGDVRAGDLVVVHDAAAALAAQAFRARGAHVVWCIDPATGTAAVDALRRYTGDVDAYLSSSVRRAPAGGVVRHVAVLMPSADVLAAKQVFDPDPDEMLGWRSALADVVADDHDEHVGGRRHIRPAVAAR